MLITRVSKEKRVDVDWNQLVYKQSYTWGPSERSPGRWRSTWLRGDRLDRHFCMSPKHCENSHPIR